MSTRDEALMSDVDALLDEYPGMPQDSAALRRLLSLAWLLGDKAGLQEGKAITNAAFDSLRQKVERWAPS